MNIQSPQIKPQIIPPIAANDIIDLKTGFKNIAHEARGIRGDIIDYSCKIEKSMACVMAKLSKHSQYNAILKTVLPQFGSILVALQKSVSIDFNLKPKIKKFQPYFNELNDALEIRNMMAHANIEVAINEDFEYFLILSVISFEKGVPKPFEKIATIAELKKVASRMGSLAGKIETLAKDW